MAWTGDGVQVNRDIPRSQYVIGTEGGELWSDFFAVVADAPHREAAYAFLNFMITPKVAAKDAAFHGFPLVDRRRPRCCRPSSRATRSSIPTPSSLSRSSSAPPRRSPDPSRAELWARVKSRR